MPAGAGENRVNVDILHMCTDPTSVQRAGQWPKPSRRKQSCSPNGHMFFVRIACSHIFPVSLIAELRIKFNMKLSTLFLMTLASSVSASHEDQEPEPPQPTLEYLKNVTLSDSKICGDGEAISVSCNLNIMELIPAVVVSDNSTRRAKNLRRRQKKEEDKVEAEAEVEDGPIYSSAEYELEVASCADTIKGGRALVAEVEGFRNFGVSFSDADHNGETYMVRQGKINFYEAPTAEMHRLGYTKSDHVGSLFFKLVIERKEIVDERELWTGMTMTMQAMADSIMLNDTGVVFADLEPTYKESIKIISADLDWEKIVNVPCSPYEYATATYSPTDSPSSDPSPSPTPDPSPYPSPSPSSNPTPNPTTPYPTSSPSADPTSYPTSSPSADPTSYPTSSPSADPTPNPTPSPSEDPTPVPTTPYPTSTPSADPTNNPTPSPSEDPTPVPTTPYPTSTLSANPTPAPNTDADAVDAYPDFFSRPYSGNRAPPRADP
jgi:hypothetical protein